MTFEITPDEEEGNTGKGKTSETLTSPNKVSGEPWVFMVLVALVASFG